MLSNDQRVPYLPATWTSCGEEAPGRGSGKASLSSSGSDLTGYSLQVPRWQQLVLEQHRRLHQAGCLGEA